MDIQEICSMETMDGKSPIRYSITKAHGDPRKLKL